MVPQPISAPESVLVTIYGLARERISHVHLWACTRECITCTFMDFAQESVSHVYLWALHGRLYHINVYGDAREHALHEYLWTCMAACITCTFMNIHKNLYCIQRTAELTEIISAHPEIASSQACFLREF